MPHEPENEPPPSTPGESLAGRVRRDGPLDAAAAWGIARQLLDALAPLHAAGLAHGNLDPSSVRFLPGPADAPELILPDRTAALTTGPDDALREDVRRLGATLWFALTGDEPEVPLPWQRLDQARITPDLGALPVLLARTLAGEPARRPATVPALLETLKVLELLAPAVPSLPSMPPRAPVPGSVAPTPEPRPPAPMDDEWWTRPTAQLAAPNRRRGDASSVWNTLILLLAGGLAGFFGGVLYEKSYGPAPTLPPPVAVATPTPEPDLPLPPSPTVGAAAVAARLDRVKKLQPDVADILKYARELRRVATLPVAEGVPFPSDAAMGRLLERFDWKNPASPYFHRTPLLLVLGYSNDGSDAQSQATSRRLADFLAQALVASKITSPIYACAAGSGDEVPEVEKAAAGSGRFVEVWVGWTLF